MSSTLKKKLSSINQPQVSWVDFVELYSIEISSKTFDIPFFVCSFKEQYTKDDFYIPTKFIFDIFDVKKDNSRLYDIKYPLMMLAQATDKDSVTLFSSENCKYEVNMFINLSGLEKFKNSNIYNSGERNMLKNEISEKISKAIDYLMENIKTKKVTDGTNIVNNQLSESSNECLHILNEIKELFSKIEELEKENTDLKEKLLEATDTTNKNVNKKSRSKIIQEVLTEIMNVGCTPNIISDIINNAVSIVAATYHKSHQDIYIEYYIELDKAIPEASGYTKASFGKYRYAAESLGKPKETLTAFVNYLNKTYGNVNCLLFAINNHFKFSDLSLCVWFLRQYRIVVPFPAITEEEESF